MSSFARYPSLDGRVAFVSGGASGIGAAMVRHLAAQGSRVGFVDLDRERGEALAEEIVADGAPKPLFIPCDVTDTDAFQDAIAATARGLGTVRVLVNNAANDSGHDVAGLTPEEWSGNIAVNLRHQFFAIQAVAPGMAAAGGGSIINMGSIIWMVGGDDRPVYSTAKAAVVGMTRALARKYGGDEVRVNCIMPGAILTERQKRLWLTPDYERKIMASQSLKRHLVPDEVARLMLFLASDDASACTGQSYIVDGGWA